MKQQLFEAERSPSWAEFERLLTELERDSSIPTNEFPSRYRQICQDLALARDRLFTEDLIGRLNQLALRGHERMYRAKPVSLERALEFVARDFPRTLRAEWKLLASFSALFFGTLAFCAYAVQVWPDITHRLLGSDAMGALDAMYGDDTARSQAQDVRMFGYYILNNVSIGFRTFASGIFCGVGSLFILMLNAIYIGLATGYVIEQDMQEAFFTFVSGHSSLELVGIVISAVAGMRLGLGLIAPGRHTRRDSIRLAAISGLPLVFGAAIMIVLAAFIEGFWSASGLAPTVHYGFGAALWVALGLYIGFAGRNGATQPLADP